MLSVLPPFENRKVLIEKSQSVADIMKETLSAHDYFSKDYDAIAPMFLGGSDLDILYRIFDFLKDNISYKEESVRNQQTKSPAAILETATCDCKCYALFIGGVLDALNRKGFGFDWSFAYASYNERIKTPGHVFVIVDLDGKDYWIDPVLNSFDKRTPAPVHIIRKKKVANMALYRISGAPTDLQKTIAGAKPAKVGNIATWVQANPLTAAGVAVLLFFVLSKKRG